MSDPKSSVGFHLSVSCSQIAVGLTDSIPCATVEFQRSNLLSQVNISIPDEAMAALNLSPGEAADEFRFAAAAKLYELGRLSSGACVAGVPRAVFSRDFQSTV